MSLRQKLQTAWEQRQRFLVQCEKEQTNSYRLFHGAVEGMPGVSVDRYGPEFLVQSFHQSLHPDELSDIKEFYNHLYPFNIFWIYNDRSQPHSRRERSEDEAGDVENQFTAQELGINYRVAARHQGEDPLLFLDLRAARRWLLNHCREKRVLNLFAYTCGAGLCAAKGGAREVWNVDFSRFALDFARENFQLNQIPDSHYQLIQSDCFAALKQLAGIPIKQRYKKLANGRRVPLPLPDYPRLPPQQFDIVFLDPPRWAKSPFGTVDLVRDYQSLFKPAVQVTADDGVLVVCNNVAKVDCDQWLESLQRCAAKIQRPVRSIELVKPDPDFPSLDNKPPLKVAICSF